MESHSVLILEEDHIFAKALSRTLRSGSEQKCQVSICRSAGEAIQRLGQEAYDLLIFSDNLPEEKLAAVLSEINPSSRDVKTILLAEQDCPEQADLMFKGIQNCLPRPFAMLDFLMLVQQVLSPGGYQQSSEKSFSLLILEDDEGLRRIYSLALSKFELGTIDQAATLEEARSLLEHKDYDILISDIRIGRDRATDILAEYRHRFEANGTRVVMCSAFGQYRNLPADVDHFLEKPISVDKLVQLVGELTGIQANGRKGKGDER